MVLRSSLVAVAVAAGGCQGFVGIDDVAGHLPHVDGTYLIGLKRHQADGTDVTIRFRGTAALDVDARSLTVSLSQLAAATGAPVSENAISGLVFPDDATAVEFDLSMAIRPEATEPPTGGVDATVSARMRFRLEGDYALCAEPTTGTLPTIGSILVDPTEPTPPVTAFDTACDGL